MTDIPIANTTGHTTPTPPHVANTVPLNVTPTSFTPPPKPAPMNGKALAVVGMMVLGGLGMYFWPTYKTPVATPPPPASEQSVPMPNNKPAPEVVQVKPVDPNKPMPPPPENNKTPEPVTPMTPTPPAPEVKPEPVTPPAPSVSPPAPAPAPAATLVCPNKYVMSGKLCMNPDNGDVVNAEPKNKPKPSPGVVVVTPPSPVVKPKPKPHYHSNIPSDYCDHDEVVKRILQYNAGWAAYRLGYSVPKRVLYPKVLKRCPPLL